MLKQSGGKTMKKLIVVFSFLFLASCGSETERKGTCDNVDTSQAPDSITRVEQGNMIVETYTWGNCSITYTYSK